MNLMFKDLDYHIVNCSGLGENFRNKSLLYDVRQNSVYEIDEIGKKILSQFKRKEDIKIISKLADLYSKNDIIETIEELDQVFSQQLKNNKNSIADTINTVKLHVCHDCNMRCKYCYAWDDNDIDFYHAADRTVITPEIGNRVIDMMLDQADKSRPLMLTFHGGEPLLYFPIIKKIVEYGHNKSKNRKVPLIFNIATNGTLYSEEISNFCRDNHICLNISLDGNESANSMRVLSSGKPAYSKIVDNIKKYKKAGCIFTIQTTVHQKNMKLVEAAKQARELGASSILFNLNREYDTEFSINEEAISFLKKEFNELIQWEFSFEKRVPDYYKSGRLTFVKSLDTHYQALALNKPKSHYCKYGGSSVSISPEGDVYVCEYQMGDKVYSMGNIMDSTKKIGRTEEFLKKLNVDNRENCQDCWARYICGGPCPHEGVLLYGKPEKVADKYCSLYRSYIETLISAFAYKK